MPVINHEDSLRKLVDSVNAAQKEQIEHTQDGKPGPKQDEKASESKPSYQAPASIPLYSEMSKAKKP